MEYVVDVIAFTALSVAGMHYGNGFVLVFGLLALTITITGVARPENGKGDD